MNDAAITFPINQGSTSKPLRIVPFGTLTDIEVKQLVVDHPEVEIVSEDEYKRRVEESNRQAFLPYLLELKHLSVSQKLDWYAKRNSQEIVYLGNNPYFRKYWRRHVLFPIKFKRLYYRIKNGELWKKHPHITDMKKKAKAHGI